MAKLRCEVVTAERTVFADAWTWSSRPAGGAIGHPAPPRSIDDILTYGELILPRGQEDELIAIGGGFLELGPTTSPYWLIRPSGRRRSTWSGPKARLRAEELMAQKR